AVQQSGQLTAGALQVNGASQIDTDITADSAVFNGAVAVGNDAAGNGVVEISAVTGAVFNGTVDSVAGETNGLVVNGPSTFMQAIGGSAALSTLTVNGSANINGGSVTTTGGQIWNGAVVLGADTTLTGTTMMFTTAVNGLSDGAQSLLINGNVVLGGTVGATARLASLQVNGTTNLNGGIVITMGNQVYNGDVLLGANTMLTAGTIQFLSSVDAAVAGAQFLDLIGNVEFGGDVGGTNALAWLDVHGTTVLGADVTTVGTQTYRSATTLASDVTLHGPLVLFFGSIDGVSPGGQSLAIDGAVIFGDGAGNDAVGGQVALASLDVTGASVITGGLVMTTGLQHYQGSVHLGADTTLGASSVHFGSTVNGLAAGGEDLVIDGDAVFDGAVGDGVLLGSLTVSGSSAVNGGLMQTVGDQSYGGDVTLGANTVFNGGSLLFESRVDSDGTPRNLVANSSGNGVTRFGGPVGATSPLGALFTNADGVTEINDDITVTAGADFQDAVQLTGNSKITDTGMAGITFRQTIDGGFELTVETLGDALFEGNIGAVSPLARFETIVHGTMIIDCSLIQATGDIVFNEGVGLVEIPVVATIGASGSLVIRSTAGDFRMGHLQKLSVLGDLTIEALSATISDLSTLGNMIIDAGAIFILTREPGLVLLANGELVMDDGVDFVAGGQFFFTVAPVAVGAGVVRFGSPTGEGDALGTLSAFTMQATGPISVENLFQPGSRSGLGGRLLPGTWLDARTQGPTTTDVGQTIAAAFPRDDEKEAVETTVMPGPATRQRLLRDLAIRSRSLDRLEVIELLGGLGIFDDTPRTTVDVLRQQPQVVVNRLPIEHVDDVLASFDELLAVADAGDIQAGLERAWRSYGQATGADATPAGLAGWLASSGDEATLMHLGLLDSLVRNIIVTGLAPAELVGPLENVARAYFPRDLGAGGMLEMVNGMEAATLPVATPRPGGTVDAAAEPAAE
ncbi:MAG: beta strand repeat-containing protein, partial [Planctomycetota bacterium]